jgi:hypothetical protein
MSGRREDPALRFWRFIDKTDGCWLWTGGLTSYGYGTFYPEHGRPRMAHRVSWELTHGVTLASHQCVLHKCDRRACVNPAHLFIGSKTDNALDRDTKGRQARGSAINFAKLTDLQVAAIRAEYTGKYGQRKELMARYSIGSSALWAIVNGHTWRHVK